VAVWETRRGRTSDAVMAGSPFLWKALRRRLHGGLDGGGLAGWGCYWLVAVRWVPVKLKAMVLLWFCRVLSAVEGRVRVTRRLSVCPAVTVVRLARVRLAPMTGREASTLVVVPEQV